VNAGTFVEADKRKAWEIFNRKEGETYLRS